MRLLACIALALAILAASSLRASADGGPDHWAVTGIAAGGALDMFAAPSPEAPKIGAVPANGRKLDNLGCINEPTYQEWLAMSEEERRQAAERRWCRIRYGGVAGWVRGKFLKED
jgi:uncharacterized protein YraI